MSQEQLGGEQIAARWLGIVQRVTVAGRQLRRWLSECLAPWSLTDSEFLLLFTVQRATRGISQAELAGQLGLSAGQISGLVERLQKRSLICLADSADRRRKLWQLSPSGQSLLPTMLAELARSSRALPPQLHRPDPWLDSLQPCPSCGRNEPAEATPQLPTRSRRAAA